MKWWQQLIIQGTCILVQGVGGYYLPNELKATVITIVALVQATVSHYASKCDPFTGEKVKSDASNS